MEKFNYTKLFTNEAFLGCVCLTFLGIAGAAFGFKEGFLVAVGGIAGLLKGQAGQE